MKKILAIALMFVIVALPAFAFTAARGVVQISNQDLLNISVDASGNITIPMHGVLLVSNDLSYPADFTVTILTTDTVAMFDHKVTVAMQSAATARGWTLAATDVKLLYTIRAGN